MKDKFIVDDDTTHSVVHWGKVNQPFEPAKFDALLQRVLHHLRERDIYMLDLFAGADPAISNFSQGHCGICLARAVRQAAFCPT